MESRIEALIWWLGQEGVDGATISMDKVAAGLAAYREYRAAEDGEAPNLKAISRAALYRDFGTVETMMDRARKYLQDHDQSEPAALSGFFISGRKSRKVAVEKKGRAYNGDISISDLVQAAERARADRDDDELVSRLEQLSARYLKEPKEEKQVEGLLDKAFEAARQGYEVAKGSSRRGPRARMLEEQMLCARSAAWAMIRKSRRKIKDDQSAADLYLSRAVTWKRNEEEIAKILKLPLTAAVARFHADRGSAVLEDDLEGSVIVLRDISAYLLDCNGAGTEFNDRVRYHDLTSIIQRMCIVSAAARGEKNGHTNLRDLVGKHFPDPGGIDGVIDKLRHLYSSEGRGHEARRDITALTKVRDMYDELLKEYANVSTGGGLLPDPENLRCIISDIHPLTFLRISEFEALHALAFARFVLAVNDIRTQTEGDAEGGPASMVDALPPTEELLTTASNLCHMAHGRTRDKAVGTVVRMVLADTHAEISDRLPPDKRESINAARKEAAHRVGLGEEEKDNPVFLELLQQIDTMLWSSMTSAPLNHKEAEDLARVARDIERYLTGSRRTAQDNGIKGDLA